MPVRADTGTPSHQPCTQSSREHPANGARRVKLSSAHDRVNLFVPDRSCKFEYRLDDSAHLDCDDQVTVWR